MAGLDPLAVLNDAFIRLYRSFAYYLDSASPKFDVGGDALPEIVEQVKEDATRLGNRIYELRGFIETGSYPHSYSGSHFLNVSRLLEDWTAEHRQLLADLESDRDRLPADYEELPLLDEIIGRVREQVATMENLNSSNVTV